MFSRSPLETLGRLTFQDALLATGGSCSLPMQNSEDSVSEDDSDIQPIENGSG